ncbi:serine hydrolase domain-containing protein [Sphingomonas sp. AR_OL41]|uniref:serine hydrolase domain-containing protein n=1 Tax=Sphingomonas sp. AR_OL41 TaxID=3042729 RepID=UPI00247FFBC7|nr:serine hydrolase domain-containing protein [Sphingomonas sp. AR_OL41]MDH7972340.1 serine hydrolase domain-containing protein [Sphingomonas sp. AR_OL41]
MRLFNKIAAGLLVLTAGAAIAQQASQLAPPAKTVAVTTAATTAPPATPAAQPVLNKTDVDAWLDGFMPYALRAGDVAGAVVVVVKDGQVVTKRGFGYADLASHKPVDPDRTLFRPGSVSKLVTWTAVMQLVEQGKINLDADINGYIDFTIPAYDGKPITMRQILTHTAGFEDHAKNLMFFDPKHLQSIGDYLKMYVPKRIFAPGTTPAYSNYGATLAGYVVERVSKMPFDDYVEKNVFAPIGMTHSTFRQPLPARLAPDMATGYPRASAKPQKFELVDPAPAGSMSSSGADMAQFMLAHLGGGAIGSGRILKPETAEMMHNTPTTFLPPLNRMELGFFETNINGREVIAHLGDTTNFHTSLHLFLADHVGLYISMNSAGSATGAHIIRGSLFADFADRYFPTTEKDGRVDAATSAQHVKLLAGSWQASRRMETGFVRALQLVGQTEVTANAKGELLIPALKGAGGAPTEWVEIAPFVWRDVHGHDRLAAKLVDGKVVRWSMDMESPFTVFERTPASLSPGWILPLTYASLAILLLAFLHWPVAALVRRHFKVALPVEGKARQAYRLTRLFAGLVLVVLIGWMLVVTSMFADLSNLTSDSDAKLWFMQIVGLIVFVGAVALAGWNALLAWKTGRRWPSKVGSVFILLAALMILYVAFTFGLLDMTVNY